MAPDDSSPAHSQVRVWLLAGLAFLATVGIGAAFVRLDERNRREAERRAVGEMALARASQLEKELDHASSAAYALALALEQAGHDDAFPGVAAGILKRFPGISGLLLAPNGVVSQSYPPNATSRAELGRDLFQDSEDGPWAIQARESDRFVIGGPFARGRAGSIAFGYLPLHNAKGVFRGFVVTAVRVADLVGASQLGGLAERGYDYRLSRPDTALARALTFVRSTELELQEPARLKVQVPGGEWALAVAPRGGWRGSATLPRNVALVLVVGVLAGVLAWNLLSQPETLRREVGLRTQRLVLANRQVMKEVLQREGAESQLLHEASHDSLTGLANRAYFLSRVAQAIETAVRPAGSGSCVLLLGLDRFKNLNDSLGPAAGDQVLKATARRLESSLRPGDLAARVGGDEFAALLPALEGPEGAAAVAQRLQETLGWPLALAGTEMFPSVSMGLVLEMASYGGPEELLRDADLAMRRAKGEGGARRVVFERSMHDRALHLQTLETQLRRAIERDELRVYYQPIISLASGRITGFEALVRWQHPERGFISPAEFIPIAEATDLVISVDRWVWNQAAREVKQLQERFSRESPFSLSVNLSARHLREPDLLDAVKGVLLSSGLSARSFGLEITESMMMENTALTAEILSNLKTLDVRLLLDDFGTGYSSMSYLHQLPVNILKIDRSFVGRLGAEAKHSEIVRTIITLAHGLAMDVVAEGVETGDQLKHLRQLGANYVQGYLFSKPVPFDALEPLLSSDRRW